MNYTCKTFGGILMMFLLGLSAACAQQEPQYFGEKIERAGAVPVKKVGQTLAKSSDGQAIKLKGRIVETCAMKGCWMTLDMGNGEEMMVKFKDYGFFVPTEGAEGKLATVEGIAKKEVIDVETLRHYAEDAGRSPEEIKAINQPEEKFTFEATGVIIEEGNY